MHFCNSKDLDLQIRRWCTVLSNWDLAQRRTRLHRDSLSRVNAPGSVQRWRWGRLKNSTIAGRLYSCTISMQMRRESELQSLQLQLRSEETGPEWLGNKTERCTQWVKIVFCHPVCQVLAAWAAQRLPQEPGLWRIRPSVGIGRGEMERRRLFRWAVVDLWEMKWFLLLTERFVVFLTLENAIDTDVSVK